MKIELDLFPNEYVTFAINCSLKELKKYLKEEFGHILEEGHENSNGIYVEDTITIWVEKFELTTARIAILMHEIFHLTFFMLNRYKIRLNKDTQEIYALFQESMFQKFVSKINLKVKRGKNKMAKKKKKTCPVEMHKLGKKLAAKTVTMKKKRKKK